MNQLVHVQAHRGASKEVTENTLESILVAAQLGVDSIEVDVQILRDGTPILFHDFVFRDRGFVTNYDLEEVSKIPWADPRFRIPTLTEVLTSLNQITDSKRPILDIELKYTEKNPNGPSRNVIAEKVLSVVSGLSSERFIAYRSFDWELLKLVRKKSPSALIIPLLSDKETHWDKALELKTQWIAPSSRNVEKDEIRKAHAQNTKVMVYTANTLPEWERLLEWGVDGITTDYPRELIKFLRDRGY